MFMLIIFFAYLGLGLGSDRQLRQMSGSGTVTVRTDMKSKEGEILQRVKSEASLR